MVPQLSGGCLCQAVRYVLTQRMRFNPYACHCTDCQRRTGSAFGIQLMARLEDFEVAGNLAKGQHVMPSGAVSEICACPRCFCRIYATNDRRPGLINLRVGTLDTSKDMTPHFHVWVRSKQPWIIIPPGTPTFDMGTPTLQDWQRLVAPTPQT
jgi:hypothetical protein